jgi:hypothetical protein
VICCVAALCLVILIPYTLYIMPYTFEEFDTEK